MISIMQPTYIPWVGYFSMINMSSDFVFLNDVQFSRQSWQQRNKILLLGEVKLITMPVLRESGINTLINQVKICDEAKQKAKHLSLLKQSYKKAKYGEIMLEIMESIYAKKSYEFLDELNIAIICGISESLGIKSKFHKSSEIGEYGVRSEYLSKIIKKLGVTSYLSASGSRDYIIEDDILRKNNIDVNYFIGTPPAYDQYHSDGFVPFLSIVDLIANIGLIESKKYIDKFNTIKKENEFEMGVNTDVHIIDNGCRFRAARLDDSAKIFEWRRSTVVDSYMVTSIRTVLFEHHLNWLKQVLSDESKLFFIMSYLGVDIGVFSFNDINIIGDSASFAWYIGEDLFRHKGIGIKFFGMFLDYFTHELKLKHLHCQVKKNNIGALSLYLRSGFKPQSETEDIIFLLYDV